MNNNYNLSNDGKILITGTGRCGTTFLMLIFTFLNMDNGFNINTYENDMFRNCNSGLENNIDKDYKILKNPCFIYEIENIIITKNIKIDCVIIPIRDNKKVSMSRVKNGKNNGGLWNANDYISQLNFNNKIIYDYLYFMTKFEIPTIFLNFEEMVNNCGYLYNKLKNILTNICYEEFEIAFNKASEDQKKEIIIVNENKNYNFIKNNKIKKNNIKKKNIKKNKIKKNNIKKNNIKKIR